MTNCKNCKMTDEYCASGDCPNDTLTAKWKRGELRCGWYYIKIADIVFIDFFEGKAWKNKKDGFPFKCRCYWQHCRRLTKQEIEELC